MITRTSEAELNTCKWARDAGVAVNGEDDFYTNPVVKGYYKNHIQVFIMQMMS